MGDAVAVERQLGERVNPASGRHMVYFACRIVDGLASLVDHEENAEVRWATLAEAEKLLVPTGGIWEPVRTYIKQAEVEPVPSAQPAGQPVDELKPLAAAIILRGDRVLLTERRYTAYGERWSWPSGKVEKGESLQEAILRELHEELLITDARIIGHVGDIDLPSGYRMSHFQVAIPADREPKLNDYEQLVRTEWMTRDEAAQAFKSLPPEIARQALVFLDEVISGQHARAAQRARRLASLDVGESTASPPPIDPTGGARPTNRPMRP